MSALDEVMLKDRHYLSRLYQEIKKIRGDKRVQLQDRYDKIFSRSKEEYQRRAQRPLNIKLNDDLPIASEAETIAQLIKDNQVVIISGETGSGKTTQLPQICLSLGYGVKGLIGHTQPRRIAARNVAARIAEEMGTPLGDLVGYQVRFEEKIGANMMVTCLTDGLLLAQTRTDKYLSAYEVIIIDEAHERSLNIDFLLGYLRRLIDKRKDLKIIITSATIDSEKFSKHFNNAPHINVSGRSYPVKVDYLPPLEDEGLSEHILRALDTLDAQHPYDRGDVLVFLPTERDIRDAMEFLQKQDLANTQIVPLFARLSSKEQQRIFHPEAQRRIVLTTNIAETSLTVPRIRYVIDSGLVRLSRYSLKTKTQRLPIEPISQASANQRAGRCGRLSDGVCVRLYDEADFLARPLYTEAEILRTNLASVILQMLYLQLGDVSAFPFVDPPDSRQINDGYRLLFELRAVDEAHKLTAIGKKMAILPVDPRFARILIEAAKTQCLYEALVIIASLSILDPRERPLGKEAQALQKQNEFADKDSDFLSLLNVFYAYQKNARALSNNQLRKWCHSYYLNPLRMREWRELFYQLFKECQKLKWQVDEAEHPKTAIEADTNIIAGSKGSLACVHEKRLPLHRALLSGLLDHVGLWDEKRGDYLGVRNRHFRIFPASVLAKCRAPSVMAALLLETSATYARCCAQVTLAEIEGLGKHLLKYHYNEPHWSKKSGNVMALETVLLYGLPIIAGRKKPFGKFNPPLAHRIFVHEALLTGEIRLQSKVIEENIALQAELEVREEKTRSRGILLDEEGIAQFYFSRLPESISSAVDLDKWLKANGDDALRMQESDLLLDTRLPNEVDYPDRISVRGQTFALRYAFNPGKEDDGVTLILPLMSLNAVKEQDFERLVPAMFVDKIEAILRRLPKQWRRQLVPIPDFARAIAERIAQEEGNLCECIKEAILVMKGLSIPLEAFDIQTIDSVYRMNFALIDEEKKTLAQSRDLGALQAQFGREAQDHFQQHASQLSEQQTQEINDWQWAELPQTVALSGNLLTYPALDVGKDGCICLRYFDNPERAARHHHLGVVALLCKKLAKKLKYVDKNLPERTQMSLIYRKISADTHLIEDFLQAVLEDVCLSSGEIRTQKAFEKALEKGEANIIARANQLSAQLLKMLTLYQKVEVGLRSLKQKSAKNDMSEQLQGLIYPRFLAQTPVKEWEALERYLEGMVVRLDKLSRDVLKDTQRQMQIAPWLERYRTLKDKEMCETKRALLKDFHQQIEAYRIQIFAQEVRSPQRVSEKTLEAIYKQLL